MVKQNIIILFLLLNFTFYLNIKYYKVFNNTIPSRDPYTFRPLTYIGWTDLKTLIHCSFIQQIFVDDLLPNEMRFFLLFFFLAMPCSMRDLSSWPGIEPVSLAVEARSPNHWTAREVPEISIFADLKKGQMIF